jgi:glycosidase
MQYGWEAHHIFNEIAQGKTSVKTWDNYITKTDSLLEKDDISMMFTSNHDENSWNGTVFERMGAAAKTMAALTFAVKGMPLIYDGQEYDMNKRLLFFEKDTIPHTKGIFYDFYTQLNGLKATYKALNGGKNAGSYTRLPTSNDASVLAFKRSKEGDTITFIANLTGKKLNFKTNLTGNYTDVLTKTPLELQNNKALIFEPWEFHFLVKK